MRTNKEKYDYYLNVLRNKAEELLIKYFNNSFPNKIYSIEGADFNVNEYYIKEIKYSIPFKDLKQPKRVDIIKIKTFIENDDILLLDENKIIIRIDKYKSTTIANMELNNFSFNEEKLKYKAEELKEKHLLKEDEVACYSCGKHINKSDAIIGSFFKNFNKYSSHFCSNKCAQNANRY